MADRMSKDARSRIMAAIRGKDTQPELKVRLALWNAGIRYGLHAPGLPGRPDLALPGRRIAIFIHGCFWHLHACKKGRIPSTNKEYWEPKLSRNVARDRSVARKLRRMGWHVFTIWECALESGTRRVLKRILSAS